MISEVVNFSKNKEIFLVSTKNEFIPATNCRLNGENIVGYDFFNDKTISLNIENFNYYFYYSNKTNNEYLSLKNHHKTIQDITKSENLILNECFIYKNIPIQEKIISIYLNTDYNELSLSSLKEFWKSKIKQYCNKFNSYIESEFGETNNDLYKNELSTIKNSLDEIQNFKTIDEINSKEDLLCYWPQILMPAPSFVKIK